MRGEEPSELRRRAERLLHENPVFAQRHQPEDLSALLNELQIYQAELEVQNEELRLAQDQLLRARDRFRELYDFAPVGYLNLSDDGIIQDINFAGAHLLDLERRRLIGSPFVRFLERGCTGAYLTALKQARNSQEKQCLDAVIRRLSGEQYHVQLDCILKEGNGDKAPQFWITLADIDLLKRTQLKLEHLNRDLEHRVADRTAELNQKSEELRLLGLRLAQAEQQERKRLASELHDYLAQLLVFAGMQADGVIKKLPAGVAKERLQELSDTLEQARQYTRTLMCEIYPKALAESGLRPAVQQLAEQMEKRGLQVAVEHEGQLLVMPEDQALPVFQSIRELLINVVKHSKANSAVVNLAHNGSRLFVTVADDGLGFETSLLQEQPASKGRFGLFSVRERIENLGGVVRVESAPGGGTRVHLEAPIPLIQTQQPLPPGTATPLPRRRRSKSPLRVLVVDDHDMVRRGLCSMIRSDKGMTVIGEAENGVQAVEATGRLRPDAVIMDINMPEMDGIQATRLIKSQYPAVQVFGISFRDDAEVVRQMEQAGASGFISKGASADELWKVLRAEA